MMPRSTSTRFFRAPGSALAMLVPPPPRPWRARCVRLVVGGVLIDFGPMTDPRLPLHGIRVLELAQVVAGPFCGALMAEFGAEGIKTGTPGRGESLRSQ